MVFDGLSSRYNVYNSSLKNNLLTTNYPAAVVEQLKVFNIFNSLSCVPIRVPWVSISNHWKEVKLTINSNKNLMAT